MSMAFCHKVSILPVLITGKLSVACSQTSPISFRLRRAASKPAITPCDIIHYDEAWNKSTAVGCHELRTCHIYRHFFGITFIEVGDWAWFLRLIGVSRHSCRPVKWASAARLWWCKAEHELILLIISRHAWPSCIFQLRWCLLIPPVWTVLPRCHWPRVTITQCRSRLAARHYFALLRHASRRDAVPPAIDLYLEALRGFDTIRGIVGTTHRLIFMEWQGFSMCVSRSISPRAISCSCTPNFQWWEIYFRTLFVAKAFDVELIYWI